MDFFGVDILFIIGAAIGLLAILAVIGAVVGTLVGAALLYIFWTTKRMFMPGLTLSLMNLLEAPIKQVLWFFKFDERNLHLIRSEIVQKLYQEDYAEVPYERRALFIPQCLRHPTCPGPTDEEGIHCKGCGKCELKQLKADAEKLGMKFFIAPGGTMVKRMIKKYRPKAIIGLGCQNEIQMGAEMALKYGIIPQTIPLTRDGCVSTIVDYEEVRRIMRLPANGNGNGSK